MSQSSTIAAFLLIGFLVFITAKGQLPGYVAVLFGPGSTTGNATADTVSSAALGSLLTTLPSLIP